MQLLNLLLETGAQPHKTVVTYGPQLVHVYDADGTNGRELEIAGAIKLSEKYLAIVVGQTVQYWVEQVGTGDTGSIVLYKKGPVREAGLDVLLDILFQ